MVYKTPFEPFQVIPFYSNAGMADKTFRASPSYSLFTSIIMSIMSGEAVTYAAGQEPPNHCVQIPL